MSVLIIYFLILILAVFFKYKKSDDFEDFAVAGRSLKSSDISISIAASCIGGSATIGLVSLSWDVGFPAVWYLFSGGAGLVVLSFFLAKRVRETGAKTLPEMIDTFINPKAGIIASIIILTAWTAILAAQFSAAGRIISSISGMDFKSSLIFGAIVISFYTAMGGQLFVIKSDKWQFAFIFLILLFILFYILNLNPSGLNDIDFSLFNEKFTFSRWSYFMLVIGGSYIVCPMLFSRLLSVKDGENAFHGSLQSVPLLILSAIIIVLIGLLSKGLLSPDIPGDEVLTRGIFSIVPGWAGVFLMLSLLTAVVSSADSCLITASTIACNDVLKISSIKISRLLTLFFGFLGFLLSLFGKDILSYLFAANDVYVSGVVAPVFVSMVFHKKFKPEFFLIMTAMAGGGILGLLAAVTGVKTFSFAGIGFSLFFSLISLRRINN